MASLSFRFDPADIDFMVEEEENGCLELSLYVMSDTYLSLDQQLSFHVRLHPSTSDAADAANEYFDAVEEMQ